MENSLSSSSGLEIIHLSTSPFDTSSSIKTLLDKSFPNYFSIIGFYGDLVSCSDTVGGYFNMQCPKLPSGSALSLIFDKVDARCALVYSSDNISNWLKKPLDPKGPGTYYVNILIYLCETVVPCIADQIVQNWYYSEASAIKNPFILKYQDISKEVTQKYKYVFEKSDLNHVLNDPIESGWGEDFAYKTQNVSINPNAKAEMRQIYTGYLLNQLNGYIDFADSAIFQENFNNCISKAQEYIMLPTDIMLNIQDSVSHIIVNEKSDVSAKLVEMHEEIIQDLLNSGIKIDQNTQGIISASGFTDGIDRFKHKITDYRGKISFDYIFRQFQECIEPFLSISEERDKKNIFFINNKRWIEAESKINDIVKEAHESAMKIMSKLEEYIIEKMVSIIRFSIKQSYDETIQCDEEIYRFVLCFNKPIGLHKSTVELDKDNFLILFEDSKKGISFFYIVSEKSSKHALTLHQLDVEIVDNSSMTTVILIAHRNQKIHFYTIENNKLIPSETIVMEQDSQIKCSYFLRKSHKMLIINEKNALMCYEINKNHIPTYFDLSNFSINTSCSDEQFIMLSVSKCEKFIALLTEQYITVIEFSTLSLVKIPEKASLIKRMIFINANKSMSLVVCQKEENRVYKLSKVDTATLRGAENLIGNPILDVIGNAMKLERREKPKCKYMHFSVSSSGYLEQIEKYYKTLSANKSFQFQGIIDKFDKRFKLNSYNTRDFLLSLSMLMPCEIAEIDKFTIFPDIINQILDKNTPKKLVKSIVEEISLGTIEEILISYENILVVSFLSSNHETNITLIESLFGTTASLYKKRSAYIQLCEINNKKLLIVSGKLNLDRLTQDTAKLLEFVTSISDLIVITIDPKEKKYIRNLVAQVLFCTKRINDPSLYNFSIFLGIYPVIKSYEMSSFTESELFMTNKYGHFALVSKTQTEFKAECSRLLIKILEFPYRWNGAKLNQTIKIVLTQIYVQDNHSIEYWNNYHIDEIDDSTETQICHSKGICDLTVVYEKIRGQRNKEFALKEERKFDNHALYQTETNHYCDEKCMYCHGFCELEYGHFGYHSLKMHRHGVRFCDTTYFNEVSKIILNPKPDHPSLKNSVIKWHDFNWETPWESIYGLNYEEKIKKFYQQSTTILLNQTSINEEKDVCISF